MGVAIDIRHAHAKNALLDVNGLSALEGVPKLLAV
jgi:hypothetical protein